MSNVEVIEPVDPKKKKGRVALIATKFSKFLNTSAIPKQDEFVYDDLGDGAFGRVNIKPDGSYEMISLGGDMNALLKDLEFSGVFANAQAAALGENLTYFFFDLAERSVKLNPNLTFPESCRYYAIMSGTDYITGRVNAEGEVDTFLVDMNNKIPAPFGDGLISKPELGKLLPSAEPVSGNTYVIEFFDDSRRIISRERYHAEVVKIMNHDLTSDVGIKDIVIQTTRPVDGEPDACYLYVNEHVNQLDYRVLLKFTDGTYRDITHEETVGGRLVIEGLAEFDTGEITPDGQDPKTFKMTYYAVDSNGNVGSFSIDKDIKIYIREDPTSEIVKIVPIYWVSYGDLDVINTTHFALYSTGQDVNVDGKVTNITTLDNIKDVEQSLAVTLQVGNTGQNEATFDYKVRFVGNDANFAEISIDNGQAFVNEYKTVTFDGTTATGTLTNLNPVSPVTTIEDENQLEYEGVITVPTHFRIRNLEGDHYYVGGTGVAISGYQGFDVDEGAYPLRADKPVIIEYINVVDGGSGNEIVSTITNVRAAYMTITQS